MLIFAIVEDEDSIAEQLSSYVKTWCDRRSLKYKLCRFSDAVSFLDCYDPNTDIVFMDIVMPYMNGMDAAKALRKIDNIVTLVFITNIANYAVNGYEVNALDFIIKPINYDFFSIKMSKIADNALHNKHERIIVQTDGSARVISFMELYYVESDGHYLVYHTERGNIRARGTMNEAEARLADSCFARCNVSYLINLSYITEIKGEDVYIEKTQLHISRAKKKEFMRTVANYFGRSV